ncbi:MAG: FHA domain-containing protein [Phycisphaerae bacterium]|nr:FHA domain-containing protein [Phycisphaerae bacterium]
MAQDRAELIFVAGPQQGERSLLMSATVVVGRHPSCDIQITEHTVSREQVRFQLTPHGWIVGSIASSPIRINGKRYKAGQQIILDTGDILGVGLETEILFVAQGDDVDAALAEMREMHPQFADFIAGAAPRAPAAPAAPAPPAPPTAALPGLPTTPPPLTPGQSMPDMPELEQDEEEALADELAEAEKARKAKVRKYAIGFGIYGTLLLVFLAAMSMRPTDEETGPTLLPPRLSDREIEKILTAKLKIPPRDIIADQTLRDARRAFDDFPQVPGAMYRAVKYFKMYLVHSHRTKEGFASPKDNKLYSDAQEELVWAVTRAYRRGWAHTKNEDWNAALRDFQYVQRMLPVNEEPLPDPKNKLFLNVRRYIMYIRSKTAKKDTGRF